MIKKFNTLLLAVAFSFSCLHPGLVFADAQYRVSGIVSNAADDSPIRNAEVKIIGDRELTEKTDVFGYYQIDGIDNGSKIEITAYKEGLSMSPEVFRIQSLTSDRTINFSASESDSRIEESSMEANISPAVPAEPQPKAERQSTVVVSPSRASSGNSSSNVPVLAKPVTGVMSTQPTYVTETKPFFSAPPENQQSVNKPQSVQQKADTGPKAFFDISGKVVYYASGLVGVRVMINNDRRFMTTTDVNGYYSIKGLKSGQDYTVSFSRDGYAFDPNDYSIENGNHDYIINAEASISKYKISGKVIENRNGVENINIKIISGVDEFTAYTDTNGYYEVDGLTHGNNYFVTAYKEGVLINPPKLIVNKLDNNRTINFSAIVQKFSISGTVTDFNGDPVKGAEVEFKTTFETLKATANSKGKYILENAPMALTYSAIAGKEGYSYSQAFVIESLDSDRELNFQIKKDKEPKSKEPKKTLKPAKTITVGHIDGNASDNNSEAVPSSKTKRQEKPVKEKKGESAVSNDDSKNNNPNNSKQKRRGVQQKSAEEPSSDGSSALDVALTLSKKEKEKEEKERKEAEKRERAEKERIEKERIEKEQEEKERKEIEKKEREQEEKERKEIEKKEREQEEKERKEIEKKEREQEEKERKEADRKEKDERKKRENIVVVANKTTEEKPSAPRRRTTAKAAKAERVPKENTVSAKPADVVAVAVSDDSSAVKKSKNNEPQVAGKGKTVKVRGKIESRGEPLKDIEVLLLPGYSVKTDERGRYEFSAVPAGKRYTLKADAKDFYFEPQQIVYDDLKSAANQDFVPYVVLEGEILSEGKAISDVVISVGGNVSVNTNQFGKYKFEKIEYGSSFSISASKTGMTFYPLNIDIEKVSKNHDGLNFYIANSIAGRVTVQGSGFGLGNMVIDVSGSTKTAINSDYSGNFIVSGLVQGGSFEITPKAGGYSFTPPSRRFTSLRESFVGQNFTAVKESYTVKGNVNIGGKPIRNAVVGITKRALKYYTDDEGNFEIANLDYGGPYTVTILSKEHFFEPIVIETLDKNTTIEFSTDISLGGVILSGGKPLPGVTVDVNGKKHKTDESGKYLITGLKYDGDYLLSLSAPGVVFSPSQKEYTAVKKSILNEVFNASAIVNGRITLNGKAFAGASITVTGDSAVYKSDSNGYYLIQNLALGQDHTIEVASPGYKFDPPKKEYKNLDSGKMSENFKAVLEGFTIKGTVMAEGRTLKKVQVSIDGASKAQTFTDDNGQFMFDGLVANKRYEITVLSKLYKFQAPSGIVESLDSDKELNLEPGQTATSKDIETVSTAQTRKDMQQTASRAAAKKYFTISGKVTFNGSPLKNAAVKSRLGEASTNASGEYSISVESGDSLEIEPFLSGYSFRPEKVSLKDIKATTSNVNFVAQLAVHNLSGYILNKDLKGVKGISIKELNSPDDFMSDSKGLYKIKGMRHKATNIVVPESDSYNFYPANIEMVLENDIFANDIYAYPKKIKKPEAFIYGGINSDIYIAENYVSIVMVSPEGGRVAIKIADNSGNVIKEFETNISAEIASAIHWDGQTGSGTEVKHGEYVVVLNGAGFKEESFNFRVLE